MHHDYPSRAVVRSTRSPPPPAPSTAMKFGSLRPVGTAIHVSRTTYHLTTRTASTCAKSIVRCTPPLLPTLRHRSRRARQEGGGGRQRPRG